MAQLVGIGKLGISKLFQIGGSGIVSASEANTFTAEQSFVDTAGVGDGVHCIEVDHHGDGSGTGGTNQCYGIDIQNHNGARQALVIHQYSDADAAFHIDNTDSKPAIYVNNTENLILNPDGVGSGDFVKFDDHGIARFQVTGQGRLVIKQSDSITTFGALFDGGSAAQEVVRIIGRAAATALNVVAATGSAGVYPMQVTGLDYGPRFTTSSNSGDSLTVNKNATGGGRAVVIANSGTGLSVDVRSGSASLWAVTAAGLPQWVAAGNQQTTVGAAGAASALPATPSKYLKVVDSAGTTFVVPCYAAS